MTKSLLVIGVGMVLFQISPPEEHQEVVHEVVVEVLGVSAAGVVRVLLEVVAASLEEDLELAVALVVASVDVVKILFVKIC